MLCVKALHIQTIHSASFDHGSLVQQVMLFIVAVSLPSYLYRTPSFLWIPLCATFVFLFLRRPVGWDPDYNKPVYSIGSLANEILRTLAPLWSCWRTFRESWRPTPLSLLHVILFASSGESSSFLVSGTGSLAKDHLYKVRYQLTHHLHTIVKEMALMALWDSLVWARQETNA